MKNKLAGMCKEAGLAQFNIISRHFPEGTGENHGSGCLDGRYIS